MRNTAMPGSPRIAIRALTKTSPLSSTLFASVESGGDDFSGLALTGLLASVRIAFNGRWATSLFGLGFGAHPHKISGVATEHKVSGVTGRGQRGQNAAVSATTTNTNSGHVRRKVM
ncbi:MAG: hypothetical protein IT462_07325 [Planctomycetes bacterium]|nr:hypothetical protein [Planctomycetota bacterium]